MKEKAEIPAFLFALIKIGCYNVAELNKRIRCQKTYKTKLVLMKRETGVNPVRTRHRN